MLNQKHVNPLLLCLFLLISSVLQLTAQSSGQIRFNIQPTNSIVKIDSMLYKVRDQKLVELPSGQHIIEIWAPNMSVLIDTIQVKANQVSSYNKGLREIDPAYKEYLDLKGDYNINRLITYSCDFAIISGDIVATYFVFAKTNNLKNRKKQVLNAKEHYETASILDRELELAREQYLSIEHQFEKSRKRHNAKVIIGIPLLVGAYGVTYRYFKNYRRKNMKEKPKEYKIQNPFVSTINNTQPIFYVQDETTHFGLSINF